MHATDNRRPLIATLCAAMASACIAAAAPSDGDGARIRSEGRANTPRVQKIGRSDDAVAILRAAAVKATGSDRQPLTAAQRSALTQVYTEPGELPQLEVAIDGNKLPLPLEHTHVHAELTGHIGRVEVTQTYQNPFTYPIEAVYVFPLPENSAVDDMKIVIGKRVIRAEIKKRDDARRTYEDARRRGHTAALLEQERPNIFTQSIANIAPGEDIDVVIRYVQTLTYDSGSYEFVFPMVVGPRFIPGKNLGGNTGLGYSPDTDVVADASRISPSVLGAGMRSGHDISLELAAEAGMPIGQWDVPTHQVKRSETKDGSLILALAENDSIANRDFVLKYRVDGHEPQATVLTHREGGPEGYFSMIVQPPTMDIDDLVGQREMIFVVDVSGSMSGVPLAMCQDAMEQALRNLRPVDTFNVITFAGRTGELFAAPRPANDTNTKAALEFISGMRAGGGTQMHLGVQAALQPPIAEGRHRYVFFMTDGYIGNEAQIFQGARDLVQKLARQGQRARVFSFGVGSSVNRHLLDGIATAGNGQTIVATTREDPAEAVNSFFRIVDRPVITDIEVDWGELAASDVYPKYIPDLFATRPLVLTGRFRGRGTTTVLLKGKYAGRHIEIPMAVSMRKEETGHPVLGTLWARNKIGSLTRDLTYNGPSAQVVEAITDLGLSHRIVTQYTSFVAVDKSRRLSGQARTISQPVEAPEGVDATAAGAHVLSAKKPMRRKASTRAYRPAPSMAAQEQAAVPSGMNRASSGGKGAGRARVGRSADKSVSKSKTKSKPSVSHDGGSESSRVSRSEVMRVVKKNARDLQRCVESIPGADGVHGKVTMRWFVAADGTVLQLKVKSSTLGDSATARAIIACLKRRVARWRFNRPAGGSPVEVVFPFSF